MNNRLLILFPVRNNQTLESGRREFTKATSALQQGEVIPKETVFLLHDTFGFPVDLTEVRASVAVSSLFSVSFFKQSLSVKPFGIPEFDVNYLCWYVCVNTIAYGRGNWVARG